MNFDISNEEFKYFHDSDLNKYEELHHSLIVFNFHLICLVFDLYIWFSNRYGKVFSEGEKANELKKKTINIINSILEKA